MQAAITSGPGPLNKKDEVLDEAVDERSITNNQSNADSPEDKNAITTVENNFAKEEERNDGNFPRSEETKEDILGFEEVSDAVY